MTNSMKTGIIGAVIGVAVALTAVWIVKSGGDPTPLTNGAKANTVQEKVTPPKPVDPPTLPPKPIDNTRKVTRVEPEAINRVFPKFMRGRFEMKGKGTDAKWGIGTTANFKYFLTVIAESRILSKASFPDGTIKVEEIRKFHCVQDGIAVSKLDFVLALDTLPLETFSKAVDVAATVWTTVSGDPIGATIVRTGKNVIMNALSAIDGNSISKFLGEFGVGLPDEYEKKLKKYAENKMLNGLGRIRSISGKSYRFEYYQAKDGTPMMITFKNEDGSEVTDEEEQMILKRVNAFIDYNVMPNTKSAPGDSWTINAEDIQEVFDPFVDGTYTGKITVERKADKEDGDWFVEMKPGSSVKVISDNGTTNGTLLLKQGKAIINPEKYTVKEMFVAGNAGLKRLSKHHFLFTARINGRCDFQGRIATFPIKEPSK